MYRVAVAIGAVCALLLGLTAVVSIPEAVVQLGWLVLVFGASFVCGRVSPMQSWRWGAVIVGIQPLAIFALLLLVGEITSPSSSTGGLVAVFIFTAFMVFLGPFAALVSHLGGWSRRIGRPHPGVSP